MNRSFQTDVWYVSLTSFILSASHVCPRSIITPATVVARVNKRVWSGPFSAWCLSSWNVEAVTSERNHRQRDGNKSSDHLWCTAVLMLRRRKKTLLFLLLLCRLHTTLNNASMEAGSWSPFIFFSFFLISETQLPHWDAHQSRAFRSGWCLWWHGLADSRGVQLQPSGDAWALVVKDDLDYYCMCVLFPQSSFMPHF